MERLEQIDLDCIYRAVECDRKEKALKFFEISPYQITKTHTKRERERKREISPTRARQLSLSLSHLGKDTRRRR